MSVLKKPKFGTKITYTGYVMHNGSFIGFNNHEFDVVKPDFDMITKDTIYLTWLEDEVVWGGWIPLGAYRYQVRHAEEGFINNEDHALDHPAWKKHLKIKETHAHGN